MGPILGPGAIAWGPGPHFSGGTAQIGPQGAPSCRRVMKGAASLPAFLRRLSRPRRPAALGGKKLGAKFAPCPVGMPVGLLPGPLLAVTKERSTSACCSGKDVFFLANSACCVVLLSFAAERACGAGEAAALDLLKHSATDENKPATRIAQEARDAREAREAREARAARAAREARAARARARDRAAQPRRAAAKEGQCLLSFPAFPVFPVSALVFFLFPSPSAGNQPAWSSKGPGGGSRT